MNKCGMSDIILSGIFQEISEEFFDSMQQHNFSWNLLDVDSDAGYMAADLI